MFSRLSGHSFTFHIGSEISGFQRTKLNLRQSWRLPSPSSQRHRIGEEPCFGDPRPPDQSAKFSGRVWRKAAQTIRIRKTKSSSSGSSTHSYDKHEKQVVRITLMHRPGIKVHSLNSHECCTKAKPELDILPARIRGGLP